MLKCNSCGAVFFAPIQFVELHDEVDGGITTEAFDVCPECHDGDISPAIDCDRCCETISVLEAHGAFCAKCVEEIEDSFCRDLSYYTTKELELLSVVTEGEEFTSLVAKWKEKNSKKEN